MLIDTTYFQQGELYIPNSKDMNAQAKGASSGNVKSKLTLFVERYERELLINALGVVLYDELATTIKDNLLQEVGKEKWKALVEGENYTLDGKTYYRFDGLLGYEKQSLVASYVFCKYLREHDVVYTTTGTVRDTAKNSTSIAATPRYVDVWNHFTKAYQGKRRNPLQPNIIVNASGEIGLDYFAQEGVQRSLYQYLLDKNELNETNFPDFEFKFFEYKNSFGI